ncbi:MAG: heat-inducible transcription repressor HrcA [Candidatus Cloacimonadota bacterium]|nr:MAG: heat-inducible transcription repressor HrcA [Candidatus Cloacimonadota bacterium]
MKKNEIRESLVLKHLITEYIKTNTTVSSRILCDKYVPHVSPATVRIDLHKLEDKNFIYQPHTSAGRVPTISGYRKYLDMIKPEINQTSYKHSELIREFLIANYKDTPLALHYIMQLLAKESDQLSFVAEPEISFGVLRKLDVFRIDMRKLLFVISLDSGMDKTVILKTDYDISEQQLKVLVRYANDELEGLRIFDIRNKILPENDKKNNNKLLALFLNEIRKVLREISNYYIHFDSNITFLEQPEFNEKSNILTFMDFIQHQDFLIKTMQNNWIENSDYCVITGEELGRTQWSNYALIFAKYEIFDVPGYLGLIGPVRMDYIKNIPVIRDIAKTITKTTKKGMMVPCYE